MNEKDILNLIKNDRWMMNILRTVRSLKLPDCWIGAGFVRSKVWDALHGFKNRTDLPDVDVIYFDPTDINEITEKKLEEKLKVLDKTVPWSVKNQARMHIPAKARQYASTFHALSLWVETATSVAVRLNDNDEVELLAPHGIDDLVNLRVNPTPHFRSKPDEYEARQAKKNWKASWPKLTINHLKCKN